MAHQPTESKRLLSHSNAEWACALKYEHLSPEAIQAAKLLWFDSIGYALGGSQQDNARILLRDYRAMSLAARATSTRLLAGLCRYRPRGRSCATSGGNRTKYPESPIAVKL